MIVVNIDSTTRYTGTMETNSTILNNSFVKTITRKLKHSPRTDIARSFINNKDMIVLCMYAHGRMTARDLAEIAHEWRGSAKQLNPYFGPVFGHTARDVTGTLTLGGIGSHSPGPMYWYRASAHECATRFPGCWIPMRTYANELTVQGVARAKELLSMMDADFFARTGR